MVNLDEQPRWPPGAKKLISKNFREKVTNTKLLQHQAELSIPGRCADLKR